MVINMAYFEFDDGYPVDNFHVARTTGMAGATALATWDVWARMIAPLIFDAELSVAVLFQHALGIEGRFTAELVYLIVSIAILPTAYIFLWRPALAFLKLDRHWTIDGLSFGIAIFATVVVLCSFTIPHTTTSVMLLGWLPGILASWCVTSLLIRLREMDRKIV